MNERPAGLLAMYVDGRPLLAWPELVRCYICDQVIGQCRFCAGSWCIPQADVYGGAAAVNRCQWGGDRNAHGTIGGEECPNRWNVTPNVWLPRAIRFTQEALATDVEVLIGIVNALSSEAIAAGASRNPILAAAAV